MASVSSTLSSSSAAISFRNVVPFLVIFSILAILQTCVGYLWYHYTNTIFVDGTISLLLLNFLQSVLPLVSLQLIIFVVLYKLVQYLSIVRCKLLIRRFFIRVITILMHFVFFYQSSCIYQQYGRVSCKPSNPYL